MLRLGEEALLLGLAERLVAVVNQEGSDTLNSIVKLIFPKLGSVFAHGSVEPEGVLGAVPVSIVINDPQSVSQPGRVHLRVEGIPGRTEDRQLGPVSASILLRGQVFCKELQLLSNQTSKHLP